MLHKLLFVVCLLCGCLQVAAQGKLSNVKVEDADGKQIEVTSLVDGKPFIMSFWGITCKPCLMELNAINDQLEEWQEEVDFKVVAVSIDDSRFSNRARTMASVSAWNIVSVFDKNQDLKRAMNVTFTPQTFIVDGQGNIVYSHTGYTPGSELELFEKLKELQQK